MTATPQRAWDEDSEALFACARAGGALCTVIGIEGSWSRRLGAQLAVLPDGSVRGSLADGCLERGLAAEAAKGGAARTLRLGRGSPYIDIRLPCGSGIDVVVDPSPNRDALAEAVARLERREPASLAVPRAGAAPFVRRYVPALRLVVLGSGPEVEALAELAAALGIACEVGRPLGEPGGTLALGRAPEIALDRWTAVAVLFHDHEWEMGILPWALGEAAFYVGAQGGASAREQRRASLVASGVSEAELARLVSPIGAVGGARTPGALALSILTDVVFRFEALRGSGRGFAAHDVAFALLAAGHSQRFGDDDKLAQEFGGTTLGLYTAGHGAGRPFAAHLVVTPPGSRLDYASLGYRALAAPADAEMADSLRVAVAAAHELGVEALLVALGDVPFADGAHLTRLLDAAEGPDGPPLFTRGPDGVLQPPALIPARWFPVLLEQHGDRGARALRAGAAALDADAATLADIDTPEQLARARAMLAKAAAVG
ncbi:MAG: XdhC family protein [Novosphingobium sp.]|nr:XdhC family protein [Novosphingobium sp.]